jgi:hypothetical protein
MDQPKPKVKIEPPKIITSQDVASIIAVSILFGGLVFAGVYYFRSLFLKKAVEKKAVSNIVAPERITASQLKPQFTATGFRPTPYLPSQAAPVMVRPQSEKIRREVGADDLLGMPAREDYDTRCDPGYYGHAPCTPVQQSLIPNFSETNKRLK